MFCGIRVARCAATTTTRFLSSSWVGEPLASVVASFSSYLPTRFLLHSSSLSSTLPRDPTGSFVLGSVSRGNSCVQWSAARSCCETKLRRPKGTRPIRHEISTFRDHVDKRCV
eukprot:scaffold625_cov324-Pavlova_lutheri.AAC.61